MFKLYDRVTKFLGSRRRFVRRVAGLALILLGVHTAADQIDDLAFRIVDVLDATLDGLAFALFDTLGGLFNDGAPSLMARAEAFAGIVDVGEKERVSMVLAFFVEIGIDFLLLDFAWGKRRSAVEERRIGVIAELKESTRELKEALWPVDLERLAIVPILVVFTTTAVLLAGAAVEQMASTVLIATWPRLRFGIPLAATAGLLTASLLVWRFLPDLIHGALLRAHERAEAFGSADDGALAGNTTLKLWRRRVRRLFRGSVLFVVVLPIAVIGILKASTLFALVERAGSFS